MALPNSTQLKLSARAALSFFLFVSTFGDPTRGQEPILIAAPVPKLEELESLESLNLFVSLSTMPTLTPEPHFVSGPTPKLRAPRLVRRSRFALDRPAIALGLTEGVSELFDGITTKYFLHHCSTCIEMDPISHSLLGSRPTWAGMIAAGSVEALAATYVNQGMRHSRHKFVRQCAPLVPLLLTGIHFIEGARNLPLKNEFYCTTPGYIVVGSHCLLPPSKPTGIASVLLPGLSPHPARISLLHFK
jgi:hypothetical protein